MSELKLYLMLNKEMHWMPVYLKVDADKVIVRNKYKRCLAMAKWCHDRWIRAYHLNKIEKTRFYVRWHKRWLKLADKFKEAK